MKTKKAIVDGKEIDIVIELDKDYMDDTVIPDKDIEDTTELSKDKLSSLLENTIIIEGKEYDGQK